MLDAREDTAYIYIFTGVIPALTIVTLTVADNNITVRKAPERIVSETAHAALTLAAAQARNNFIDLITAWEELATFKRGGRSFITTDDNLINSGANKGDKSDSRHVISEEKNSKKKRACETKARNKSNKIKE
jgi:hypothetical protein